MRGYNNAILQIDLNNSRIQIQPFPKLWRQRFLGGRGLGVHIICQKVEPTTESFHSSNVIVMATGPVTGSGIPLGSRYDVVTKSPLTGTLSSANSGGFFGAELKKAGVDAIVFSGSSKKPVLLWLTHSSVELKDASPYWGMTTGETTIALQNDLGDVSIRVACIGPAGERLSRMACIINEYGRAAGRGGMGAVMGSKMLKAIAVRAKVSNVDPDVELIKATRDFVRSKIEKSGMTQGSLHKYGTAALVNLINENHLLPTRNFQEDYFPSADRISGEEMTRTILKQRKGCYACPVACGRVTEVNGSKGEGPEYETIWSFGPACGIDDLKVIAQANYLCNDLGLDTISTGSTIACAMELSARGFLKEHLRFGDNELLEDLVKKISYRQGIGNELAEGSYRFASKYGHPELSMTVKKQEIPGYDPRRLQGQGLEYATSVRGACHVYGNMVYPEVLGIPIMLDPLSTNGKPYWTKRFQDLTAAIDSLGMCLFTIRALSAANYATIASNITGLMIREKELLMIGERIWNLQKIFNLNSGLSKDDDTLPARLLIPTSEKIESDTKRWHRSPLLDEYYTLRGWDREGHPYEAKLREREIQ